MATYKLTIDKLVENPKHAEQVTEWRRDTRRFNEPAPERFELFRSLEVELSQEEFESVKRGVLGEFK